MKTAYFVKINAENNNNRYYKMYQNSPNSFLVEIGRVGIQPVIRPYPISSWDTVYQKKLAEGYIDRTPLTQITKSGKYKEIEDPEVRELIDYLQKESNIAIKENYTVSFDEITPKMLQEADKLLEQYGNNWQENNKILCKLFSVIPRKMDQVKDYLLPENASEEQIFSVLQREREFLDVLRTKIHMDRNQIEKGTLLDSWKTSITPVTSEKELGKIKEHMGRNASQFVRAFRVRNQTLDDAFWKNYKKNGYPLLLSWNQKHELLVHYEKWTVIKPQCSANRRYVWAWHLPGKQSTEESALYFFAWILICQGSFRTGISLCTEICIYRSHTYIPLGTLYDRLYCQKNRTT